MSTTRIVWIAWCLLLCASISAKDAPPPELPRHGAEPGAARTYGADKAVRVTAVVDADPTSPTIALAWPAYGGSDSYTDDPYQIYRKGKDDASWGDLVETLTSVTTSWTDTNVTIGEGYEYKIQKGASASAPHGFIYAGIQLPPVDSRGKIVLLVDDTQASALTSELEMLKEDLVAEGWGVLRHDVSPTTTVVAVKSLIQADYEADPENVKAVYLIGHVPVPYSGNMNPDGHSNHRGAWAADAFYGDMDGTWTDTTVDNVTASRTDNHNVPGDGKYDQSTLPSTVELGVGRVDLNDMPAFALSETELLRQYLNKAHSFRITSTTVQHRALVRDRFTGYSEGFSQSGWRLASLVGTSNVQAGLWEDLIEDDYLWAYGCGGGSYTKANGVSTTTVYAVTTYKAVFNMIFGSYFGDWDNRNNFLRAPLGNPTYGLINAWAGRPNWFFHHMALGETTGFAFKVSTLTSYNYSYSRGGVHVALMGDPALRMKYVEPPTGLTAVSQAGSGVLLGWNAVSDPDIIGYHVYRSASVDSPFVRVTDSPILATTYTDPYALNGANVYAVRSVKLEETPSGTYYNTSLGDLASVSHTQQVHTLQGTVTASSGSPVVQGVAVQALGRNANLNGVTDAGGHYQIAFMADQFDMHLAKTTETALSVAAPGAFDWLAAANRGMVDDTTLDLSLPAFATVTGRVLSKLTGAGGAKVEAVATVANPFSCYDVAWSEGAGVRAVGEFSLTLIPGIYDFTVTSVEGVTVALSGVSVTDGLSLPDFDVSAWPSVAEGNQVVHVTSSDGSYWMAAYNYSTNAYVATALGTGDDGLSYPLDVEEWVGVFLYDLADGYVEAYYIYCEALQ